MSLTDDDRGARSAEHDAREYLDSIAKNLTTERLNAAAGIARGNAANEIVSAAERSGVGLIVLATHDRRNIEAFWAGSVTRT